MSAPREIGSEIRAIIAVLRAASAGGYDPCLEPSDVLKLSRMFGLLQELQLEMEDRSDVVDGSYDGPSPNWEMRWAERIREVLP